MKTINELMDHSIRITNGMLVCWPQFHKEDTIEVSDLIPKFPGRFATNNSTVAFIWENNFYVVPYTGENISILKGTGLTGAYFYVPFSNWDYPVHEKARWDKILEEAEIQNELEFTEECEDFCDEHGFGKISDEALANCFRIPRSGFWVKHPVHLYESFMSPVISGCLDCIACNNIGTFNTNNGRVVFIYRNGTTFIAKGYGIVKELIAAGYKENSSLFVPLSNGEDIEDPYLREKWESIQKQ